MGFSGLVTLGLLAWATTLAPTRPEEATDASGNAGPKWRERHTFQNPSGTRIDVSTNRENLSDEELLAALEEAARQTRERIKLAARPADAEAPKGEPGVVTYAAAPNVLPAEGFTTAAGQPPAGVAPLPPDRSCIPAGQKPNFFQRLDCVGLPADLLWENPLANPLQPRMAVVVTSLDNANTHNTINTAIGAEVGLFRVLPQSCPGLMIQQDFFAVVLSRWADNSEAVASDFRFGFPTTFRYGDWEGKLGFEHTSTHLGDDFIKIHDRFKDGHVRDEIVAGLAYRFWNQVRVYGIFGLAPGDFGGGTSAPDRYNVGIEWSKAQTTGWRGQPFAACDLEIRSDQDYQVDVSTEVGWQWQVREPGRRDTSVRIGLEYYDGKSPFGQFFRDREHFFGTGVWIDF